MALRSIELFAGGGGLALGLERACGARAVCYVEREAYAAAVLAARMEDGSLAPAPIWSDVRTFDGHPWRGVVDLVAGGFPCQDISNAGLRAGIDGERSGLWSEFARIIREVEPGLVFVENVAALATRGLDRVLGDLASLGFDAEWGVFRAKDAGAPHERARLFVVGHTYGVLQYEERQGDAPVRLGRPEQSARVGAASEVVADPDLDRCKWERSSKLLDRDRAPSGRDPHGRGVPWPPGPTDAEGWRKYLEDWPGLEPAVRRGADGLACRVDRLRVLGNGVVPDQAAIAFRVLWDRAMKERP